MSLTRIIVLIIWQNNTKLYCSRTDVCKKLLQIGNVLYCNVKLKVLYIQYYCHLFICRKKIRSKYTNTLIHHIHKQLCVLKSKHFEKYWNTVTVA